MPYEEELINVAEIEHELSKLGMEIGVQKSPDRASYFTAFVTDKKGQESVIKVLTLLSTNTRRQFQKQLEVSNEKGKYEFGDYLLGVERFPLGDFLALKMPSCKESVTEYSGDKTRNTEGTLNCILDLAKGTSVLHEMGLVHRDIHSGNGLLLGDRWRLTDYSRMGSSGIGSSEPGIKAYWAPEVWTSDDSKDLMLPQFNFTFDSDIWALGAVFYQLMIKQIDPPWFHDQETPMRILKGDWKKFKDYILKSDYVDGITKGMVEFALYMMHPDLSERIRPIQKVIAGLERLLRGDQAEGLSTQGRFNESYENIEKIIKNAGHKGAYGTTPINTICEIMDEYEGVLLKIADQLGSRTAKERVSQLEKKIMGMKLADKKLLEAAMDTDFDRVKGIPDRLERLKAYAKACIEKEQIGVAWGPPLENSRYAHGQIESNSVPGLQVWVEMIENPANWKAIVEKYAGK